MVLTYKNKLPVEPVKLEKTLLDLTKLEKLINRRARKHFEWVIAELQEITCGSEAKCGNLRLQQLGLPSKAIFGPEPAL